MWSLGLSLRRLSYHRSAYAAASQDAFILLYVNLPNPLNDDIVEEKN